MLIWVWDLVHILGLSFQLKSWLNFRIEVYRLQARPAIVQAHDMNQGLY